MEVRPLRRKLRGAAPRVGWLPTGEVKIPVTGLGRKAAETAAEKLLDRYPVRMVISTGFAGALTSEMEAGQLFASDTVHAPDNSPLRTDEALLERALAIGRGDLRIAALVSVPSLVGDKSSREALHAAHGALAVDMESYWIARAAMRRRIPCLVVRAVSDTVEQKIFSLRALPALWRQSRLAAFRLADFIVRFISQAGQG
jgi:nucleoside phosphorylase